MPAIWFAPPGIGVGAAEPMDGHAPAIRASKIASVATRFRASRFVGNVLVVSLVIMKRV
jgi:hypothetical protein